MKTLDQSLIMFKTFHYTSSLIIPDSLTEEYTEEIEELINGLQNISLFWNV